VSRTARIVIIIILVASTLLTTGLSVRAQEAKPDLTGIKTFLLEKTEALNKGAQSLKKNIDAYYDLAKAAKFDYAALWSSKKAEVIKALEAAKADWMAISPTYEQAEGIVAGVPTLQKYDVILDAGAKDEVEYDITLPDGKVLAKPGNLFGLLETTLWGTEPTFITTVKADFDGNGKQDFGEVLPDANALKGFGDSTASYAEELEKSAKAWEPTASDAFTALVVMVPTMSEYFESWKESRFILGDKAARGDFAVISRLSDIQDILSGLQVVYKGVSPMVAGVDKARDTQIAKGLDDLRTYVAELYKQEKDGKKFTPEEAELFGSEAQAKATAITGQISQVAAQLKIKLAE
jgi:hypothetical protein